MAAVSRGRLAAVAGAIVGGGLVIRFCPVLPAWLRDAGGGALYVCLLAVLFRLVWPVAELAPARAAWLALIVTCLVEFSQLIGAPVLNQIRGTLPGRLALGSTFSWWDFSPYFLGAAAAACIGRRWGPIRRDP